MPAAGEARDPGAKPFGMQIQTITGCNAHCVMCPAGRDDYLPAECRPISGGVGDSARTRGKTWRMSEALFARIVDDLAGIEGAALHLFNEPLLDPHLERRVARIRARWPSMLQVISSNGALLTPTRARALFAAGVTILTFGLYTSDPDRYRRFTGLDPATAWRNLDATIRAAAEYGAEVRVKVLDGLLVPGEEDRLRERFEGRYGIALHIGMLHDRAGNVRLEEPGAEPCSEFGPGGGGRAIGCLDRDRPWRVMHVLADGRVVLCCNDWDAMHVLGDLRRQSIAEVWRGAPYQGLRRALGTSRGPRPALLCDRCKAAARCKHQ